MVKFRVLSSRKLDEDTLNDIRFCLSCKANYKKLKDIEGFQSMNEVTHIVLFSGSKEPSPCVGLKEFVVEV